MKTHEIKNFLNQDVMLVQVPEKWGITEYKPTSSVTIYDHTEKHFGSEKEFDGYGFLGKYAELKDEDVEPLIFKSMKGQHFKNYAERKKPNPDYAKLWCKTAIESFNSALKAEGLYLNGNPYSKPSDEDYLWFISTEPNEFARYQSINIWHEAEARTFDKTRTVVLIKNKEQ